MEPMATDTRKGDRHKRPPMGLRLSEDLADWVDDYAAQTGRTKHAIVVEAVERYRAEVEGDGADGAERPRNLTCDTFGSAER